MILCLDVGNSHIYAGVFAGNELQLTFRHSSRSGASSDEIGLFLKAALRENGLDPAAVQRIALCSVVPDLVYTISSACRKYFGLLPFILQAGVRTSLKILYRNPLEVGADRIANAIGAVQRNPGENLFIIDMGTATTIDVVNAQKEYLGGVIFPGLRMSMLALSQGTAKLGVVEIAQPEQCLGRTTANSIQSGLYYGHVGGLKLACETLAQEAFGGQRPRILATGGFASLLENAGLFDEIVPDLVLRGLVCAAQMNT